VPIRRRFIMQSIVRDGAESNDRSWKRKWAFQFNFSAWDVRSKNIHDILFNFSH
jgi:hypothetical protein